MKHKYIQIMKAVIYTRVSTKNQDVSRQVSELMAYARQNNIEVIKIFKEYISGRQKLENRPEGKEFIAFLRAKKIKLVLVSELSRLGRSTKDLLNVFERLSREMGINIYIHDKNLYTIENGRISTYAEFMFTILSAVYSLELEQTRERIISGLQEARNKGKRLGRPKGTVLDQNEIIQKYPKVKRHLSSGLSIRQVAELSKVSNNTVLKVKRALKAKNHNGK